MTGKWQHTALGALVAAAALPATTTSAHEEHTEALEELVIYGRAQEIIGVAKSASEGLIGYDDIQLPPMLRVGELVESVPGMVATQHSGTGKANQYFLRGFNLDHGTDFSGFAEGVPINMRTHGHGQGYLDLNFMIPEIVETTFYRKGPYSASLGDFSSAGSVAFSFYDKFDEVRTSLTAGEDAFYRGLLTGGFALGDGNAVAALDVSGYDGPWELEENLEQYKAYLGYSFNVGEGAAKITFQGYDGRWDSTDQIPRRAVESGLVSSLGFLDGDLGGQTERYALTGALHYDALKASAYIIDYDFTLFSNFTYFLEDENNGDEFEQRDDRTIYGGRVDGIFDTKLGERQLAISWGGDLRYDDIGEVGLYSTAGRVRNGTVRRDSVEELSIGIYGEAELLVNDRLRTTLGLRADWFDWEVDASRDANDGSGDDALLSPKLGAAYRITDGLEGYVNWGKGMHSNDVRGATITVDPATGDPAESVDVLVESEGAEVGLRFERGKQFNASVAAFWLELDSELVFVGDAGATEVNDGTERTGLEASAFWQANEWLAFNAAYTVVDAEFKSDQGGGRDIPGAVESTFTLGANAVWLNGFSATARLRYLGEAPLIEDGSVTADDSLLVNAGVAYARDRWEVRLDAFNLFDSDDDDIAYFYASRLAGEPADGIEDVHFHPLEPRTVRASFTLRW